MKKLYYLPILILMISVLLPNHSVADAAERKNIANGVYQVELSFQSDEAAGQDVLFSNKAELTVKEGHYSLSVPVQYQNVIKKVTAKQSGEKMKSLLITAENLVQFDMKDIQEKFTVEGTFQWSADDVLLSFSQEIAIVAESLPAKEQKPAVEEQGGIDGVLSADGKKDSSVKNGSVNSNETKTPIVKKLENRSYTPRPSRHSKEAAEAREKQQAAEEALKAASQEEQLAFDRTQDEPAREQREVKAQAPVTPAVVQVAGEEAEVKLAPSKVSEGPTIPFDLMKVGILLLACILSGVLLIRRMINRKKEIVNE